MGPTVLYNLVELGILGIALLQAVMRHTDIASLLTHVEGKVTCLAPRRAKHHFSSSAKGLIGSCELKFEIRAHEGGVSMRRYRYSGVESLMILAS